MVLSELLSTLRSASGIQQKTDIQRVQQALCNAYRPPFANGDDAAIIPGSNGYDLLAGEGFLDAFVEADPWFAGWCGVMVNVSDIAAMGGRPVAIVNMLWGADDERSVNLLQGISAASQAYQVPVVGGHTNLRAGASRLAVSILGRATRVLSSFQARPGQRLVCAMDLRGAYQSPFLNWNAATSAPPERLRQDVELLPMIAEQGLADSAKDISQAGLLGTCVMLMESANAGADIDLDKIPKPPGVDWLDWLQSFPSYGYLLTTDEEKVADLVAVFSDRNIHAAEIGCLTDSRVCRVYQGGTVENFWDLTQTPLTAMEDIDRA